MECMAYFVVTLEYRALQLRATQLVLLRSFLDSGAKVVQDLARLQQQRAM